jgi:hypothetical protein
MMKKTKLVYSSDSDKTKKEILVDVVLNLNSVDTVLPGRKPGYLTIVMSNKLRYTIQDDIESILSSEREK